MKRTCISWTTIKMVSVHVTLVPRSFSSFLKRKWTKRSSSKFIWKQNERVQFARTIWTPFTVWTAVRRSCPSLGISGVCRWCISDGQQAVVRFYVSNRIVTICNVVFIRSAEPCFIAKIHGFERVCMCFIHMWSMYIEKSTLPLQNIWFRYHFCDLFS